MGLLSWISFQTSLLAYRNAIDFCVLILCATCDLIVATNFLIELVVSLGLFAYEIMSSENKVLILLSNLDAIMI